MINRLMKITAIKCSNFQSFSVSVTITFQLKPHQDTLMHDFKSGRLDEKHSCTALPRHVGLGDWMDIEPIRTPAESMPKVLH